MAAGASIGADGAVDGCAWLNSTDRGRCLGAFALSPSSLLTLDFRATTDALLAQDDPIVVYCLFGLYDAASKETCGEYHEIQVINFGFTFDYGLELILVDRRPDPLNLLQEFILKALEGTQ